MTPPITCLIAALLRIAEIRRLEKTLGVLTPKQQKRLTLFCAIASEKMIIAF
jgi:hypothetical protein